MRRLYQTTRSPFARKVAICLHEKGLEHEVELVDLAQRSPEFLALGPYQKVPVLVDQGGVVVADSTVIVEYLEDRYPVPALRGASWEARLWSRRLEELGDCVADAAIAVAFGATRGSWGADRGRAFLGRALPLLSQELPRLVDHDFGVAQASVVAALGYLGFRLGQDWRAGEPDLAAWFDAAHLRPSVAGTVPQA